MGLLALVLEVVVRVDIELLPVHLVAEHPQSPKLLLHLILLIPLRLVVEVPKMLAEVIVFDRPSHLVVVAKAGLMMVIPALPEVLAVVVAGKNPEARQLMGVLELLIKVLPVETGRSLVLNIEAVVVVVQVLLVLLQLQTLALVAQVLHRQSRAHL